MVKYRIETLVSFFFWQDLKKKSYFIRQKRVHSTEKKGIYPNSSIIFLIPIKFCWHILANTFWHLSAQAVDTFSRLTLHFKSCCQRFIPAEYSISAVFLTALQMLSIIIKATKCPLYFSEYDRRTSMTSKMPVEGISCYKAETGNRETKLLILF